MKESAGKTVITESIYAKLKRSVPPSRRCGLSSAYILLANRCRQIFNAEKVATRIGLLGRIEINT